MAECQEILKQLNLKDVFKNSTKAQRKDSVTKEITVQNEYTLRKLITKSLNWKPKKEKVTVKIVI